MDDSGIFVWYADASFAVHKDFKLHTGGTGTLGKGSVISKSFKQKINTKSTTKAELVAADDISNILMWSKLFLKAQGYNYDVVLMQDNSSTKLLLENGRGSSTKRTRHLNIRYYYLHDCVKRGELDIKHCSTEDMIADYLSKPVQGKQFFKLHSLLMNLKEQN